MGFYSLQHLKDPRSTRRGRKPARYVPPSGFGYPLDGLLPRIPCRFSFAPAALMGFTLRRSPSREVFAGLSTGRNPHTVCPAVFLPPEGARPARRTSVTGLIPPESAWRPRGVLIRQPLAPPMGFAPLRPATKTLNPNFSGPPLARFTGPGDCSPNSPAPQSIDRSSLRSVRRNTEVHTGRSNPSGVLAPACS